MTGTKCNNMESVMVMPLLVVILVLPLIWAKFQTEIETLNFRDNLAPIWIREPAINHSLKPLRRVRRTTKMSKSEQLKVVRLHNIYRGMVVPSAADMEYMEWSESLAAVSQRWADTCLWKHGNPPHHFPGSLGQNLYRGSNPNVAEAMRLWFEEYKDYDYYTLTCKPNENCGHYTQIVWSKSRFVGCGISEDCWSDYKYYIVCNYFPGGNIRGVRPYKEGRSCSLCGESGNGFCSKNSCVSRYQCKEQKLDCGCALKCYNCGKLDSENCKCKCKDGWKSADCTEPCVELKKCQLYECLLLHNRTSNHPCEESCGICKSVNQNDLRNTCCDGVVCPYGQVYYPSDRPCVCRILCPGPKCGAILQRPYFILLVIAIFISECCVL